ncbi:MAG: HlyD family efflux transporter periplasmic adaptor subunit [Acidimicrobiales bacterium]
MGVALAALGCGGAAAGGLLASTSGSLATGYRTARVTTASVDATLRVPATVEPASRVTVSFGMSGKVGTVAVKVGQHVTAGQVVATLDPTPLVQKVKVAEANVTAAEAQVAADKAAPAAMTHRAPPSPSTTSVPHTASASPSGLGAPSGSQPPATAGTPPPSGGANLAAAQKAVVTAQKKADAAEQAASSAVTAAAAACGGTAPATCNSALAGALTKERALAAAQQVLAQAEGSLATLLAGSPAPTTTPSTTTPSTTTPSTTTASTTTPSTTTPSTTTPSTTTPSTTTPTSTPSTGTPTAPIGGALPTTAHAVAATVAGDQATVDADHAALILAQQALAGATLTSPIGGTVAAVAIVPGEAVSAGSATQAVTVLGPSGFDAVATLTPRQVPEVAQGDQAVVSVEGGAGSVSGTVVRVGPVDTSHGDSYPLVVALPPGTGGLVTGALAELAVVVHHAPHVLAVPTSAVHTSSGKLYVLCLNQGRPERAPISVGLLGDTYTQIRSGVHAGAVVVLAELTRPIPTPLGSIAHRNGTGTPLQLPTNSTQHT